MLDTAGAQMNVIVVCKKKIINIAFLQIKPFLSNSETFFYRYQY